MARMVHPSVEVGHTGLAHTGLAHTRLAYRQHVEDVVLADTVKAWVRQ